MIAHVGCVGHRSRIFRDSLGVEPRTGTFAKRLEDGEFRWPKIEDGMIRLTAAQFSALIEGLDRRSVNGAKEVSAPIAAS